jgi:RNA polymerase sigma-70 factor (ECF subfamily)
LESDERLMLRFQGGDVRAFEELVRRHRTPVFSFLLRLVGDRGRAEDLCQETFLRVVAASERWEPRALFRTWLYAVARNQAFDEGRRQAFRRTEPLDDPARAAQASDDPPRC